jgi:hypothetical protein
VLDIFCVAATAGLLARPAFWQRSQSQLPFHHARIYGIWLSNRALQRYLFYLIFEGMSSGKQTGKNITKNLIIILTSLYIVLKWGQGNLSCPNNPK